MSPGEAPHPLAAAEEFRGVIPYPEAQKYAEENGMTIGQLMLDLLPLAETYARPAISSFPVGAIVQGSTTKALYLGANIEFVGGALSFTMHAEQAGTINAWQNGEQGLLQLAVTDAPCGYCRQFLYETSTAAELMVLLKEREPALLETFLPDPFGPKQLEKSGALMDPENAGLKLDSPSSDPVVLAALAEANASYAIYTGGHAGIGVQTRSGEVFGGRLAENAAYNPSVSPLESALDMWILATRGADPVTRVVLIEVDGIIADQESATRALLPSLGGPNKVTFERLGAHT